MFDPQRLLKVAFAGSALHVAATGLGLLGTNLSLKASAWVNVGLFIAGIGVFVWAFLRAAERSRTEQLWFGGVFFLTGDVAPRPHRNILLALVAVQVVVGVGGASLRPFTALAFGVLVPLFGLGMLAAYGAMFGRFASNPELDT